MPKRPATKKRTIAKKRSVVKKRSVAKKRSVVKKQSVTKKRSVVKKQSVTKKQTDFIPEYIPKPVKNISKTIFPRQEDDGTTEPGDVIFGKPGITSLSGPISFYYLRPTKNVYQDGNGKYFPLIVLFGDMHRSIEKTCDRCACSIDRKNGCCYMLSDYEFLKKLDRLADPQHPVDFYTETFLSGTNKGFKGGVMAHLTTGEMVSCYHRDLRGTEKYKCPTKNIRWQAGDARQSGSTSVYVYKDENKDEKYIYYGEDTFVENLMNNDTLKKEYERKKYIEFQFDEILFKYLSSLVFANNTEEIEEVKTLTKKFFDESRIFKSIQDFQRLLLSLCEGNENTTLNFENFTKAFFQLCTKENSLIYKQIQKQSYEPFRQIEEWADFYKRSIEFNAQKNQQYVENKITKKTMREMITNLPSFIDNPKFEPKFFDNFSLIRDFGLALLDIYTIARIWKQPTGGIRSSLSFGYFGDFHVENIVNLLLSTNAYELVCAKPNKDGSRCQEFEFTLNLSKEVRQHNQKIDA